MDYVFWTHNLNLGRLHICVGRNDYINSQIADFGRPKRSAHLIRHSGNIYISARIGSRFINIDLI